MIRSTKIATLLFFVASSNLTLASTAHAQVAVGISIHIGPPVLPSYPQPPCPAPGYFWTPGYWAYGPAAYYWVPGTWVVPPAPGLLWTPGYWGAVGGTFVWHAGYWGPHVGFYGGINYGYGYTGVGFVGGVWHGGMFHYNTAVTNVNINVIHNTYVNDSAVNRTVFNNVSYRGGSGGTTTFPTAAERAAMNEQHVQPTSLQTQHEQMARNDHRMLASVNHGQPAVAATSHPGAFNGTGVIASRAASAATTRSNVSTNLQGDRPPNARTNNASNPNGNRPSAGYSRSADRPTAATHPENRQTAGPSPNRPPTAANHGDAYYSSPSRSRQSDQNRPPERQSRSSRMP